MKNKLLENSIRLALQGMQHDFFTQVKQGKKLPFINIQIGKGTLFETMNISDIKAFELSKAVDDVFSEGVSHLPPDFIILSICLLSNDINELMYCFFKFTTMLCNEIRDVDSIVENADNNIEPHLLEIHLN